MQLYNWDRIEEEQMNPLVGRKVIHTSKMTIALIRLRKYAIVPEHSHSNEQVSAVQSGSLRFVVGGREQVARAGDMVEIPPGVPHLVEALEDSVAIDTFAPVREDWVRGDDAYLRK